MSSHFDVAIIGLGAMGGAAAYHLARQGVKVAGFDRFNPPHLFGSSHGRSRIIREAYFEDPLYVPLIQRAYKLWADLEQRTGRQLLRQTGGLMIGPPDGALISGARRSAAEHNLDHQLLSAAEVRGRFPALRPPDEMEAVWEPRAGILFPEACIAAHLDLAREHGARLHLNEAVVRWEAGNDGVRVWTGRSGLPDSGTRRQPCHARQLLISAGGWVQSLLPDWEALFTVERQVMFWFDPRRNRGWFQPDHCPIHVWEHAPGRYFYGFPDLGEGIKVAGHHDGEFVSPDELNREVLASDIERMRELAGRFLPDGVGPLRSAAACLYTNTPDGHFLIDRHPAWPQVLIASPCSGHGFKFSSVIGEILSELLLDQTPRFDLSFFCLSQRSRALVSAPR